VVRRYRESEAAGDITRSDRPSPAQLEQIARAQVVQRYLDQVNRLLGRNEKVDMSASSIATSSNNCCCPMSCSTT
jgi:hypothetical protein